MIENYLQALANKQEVDDGISPLVKSLTGVISVKLSSLPVLTADDYLKMR